MDHYYASHILMFDVIVSAFYQGKSIVLVLFFVVLNYLCLSVRITKTGNLPNLSYVKRNPDPLGTKF